MHIGTSFRLNCNHSVVIHTYYQLLNIINLSSELHIYIYIYITHIFGYHVDF